MGIYDEVVEVPRRTMILFFLVDTSGSMSGSKIGTVNTAIENVLPELQDLSSSNADAQVKIAVMEFSTGIKWMYDSPIDAENFRWNYLEAGGLTSFGEACEELNSKLSRSAFMSDASGSFAPAIFLMSDGEPTDNYQKSLDKLKQNNWFKKAIKVALAIGEGANQLVLQDFTGNSEAVLTAHTPEILMKMIQFVSVRSSEIGSRSANIDASESVAVNTEESSKQRAMIDEIKTASAEESWGDFDDDEW